MAVSLGPEPDVDQRRPDLSVTLAESRVDTDLVIIATGVTLHRSNVQDATTGLAVPSR